MAVGDGAVTKSQRFLARVSCVTAAITGLSGEQLIACVIQGPPPCQAGENMESCRERAQIWYDEREAARIEYEKKTPQERALIEQAGLWDNHEFIFVARIDKIKIDGKIYPQPQKKKTTPKSAKTKNSRDIVLPPIPAPMPVVPMGGQYEAFIRPVHWIKGTPSFTAAWRSVGGWNSCGSMPDGALAYSDPDDEFIILQIGPRA
ncbi:MAG: hypothetical protein HC843_12825 [Sphingomonadales bacterium]|nr:hypothetical protein [Sphingomonadales bacterium]